MNPKISLEVRPPKMKLVGKDREKIKKID